MAIKEGDVDGTGKRPGGHPNSGDAGGAAAMAGSNETAGHASASDEVPSAFAVWLGIDAVDEVGWNDGLGSHAGGGAEAIGKHRGVRRVGDLGFVQKVCIAPVLEVSFGKLIPVVEGDVEAVGTGAFAGGFKLSAGRINQGRPLPIGGHPGRLDRGIRARGPVAVGANGFLGSGGADPTGVSTNILRKPADDRFLAKGGAWFVIQPSPKSEVDLAEVAEAGNFVGFAFGLGKRRKKKGSEEGNDGDDDEEFEEGESGWMPRGEWGKRSKGARRGTMVLSAGGH